MSEAHTPGPWTVAAGSHVCGGWGGMVRVEASGDFHSNGQAYPDGGSTKSYTNVVCGIGGHSETAIANANLISAAPDLLAALKRMEQFGDIARDFAEGQVEVDDEMVSTYDLLEEARAAIAKAEGRAQ